MLQQLPKITIKACNQVHVLNYKWFDLKHPDVSHLHRIKLLQRDYAQRIEPPLNKRTQNAAPGIQSLTPHPSHLTIRHSKLVSLLSAACSPWWTMANSAIDVRKKQYWHCQFLYRAQTVTVGTVPVGWLHTRSDIIAKTANKQQARHGTQLMTQFKMHLHMNCVA